MSHPTISVTNREGIGRGKARRLRAQGEIPAVIYGKDGAARHLAVGSKAFRLLMRELAGRAMVVDVDEAGNKVSALIRDVQRNPLTDEFEHVDFMEVYNDRKVEYDVPINIVGEAFGVRNEKGVLNMMVRTLKVRCLPADLPTKIAIDVTELKKSEGIQIGKLTAPAGCQFLGRPDVVVVIVTK